MMSSFRMGHKAIMSAILLLTPPRKTSITSFSNEFMSTADTFPRSIPISQFGVRMIFPDMLAFSATNKDKIFNPIIEFIPIEVMNCFTSLKGSSNRQLHNMAMFIFRFAKNTYKSISMIGDIAAFIIPVFLAIMPIHLSFVCTKDFFCMTPPRAKPKCLVASNRDRYYFSTVLAFHHFAFRTMLGAISSIKNAFAFLAYSLELHSLTCNHSISIQEI